MDSFIQVILDLIMDGSIAAVSDRKVPMVIRVIAAIILIAAFCSLIGFCFYLMFREAGWQGKVCGTLILLITLRAAYRFFEIHKHQKR